MEQLDGTDESMLSEELYALPFGITNLLSSRSWIRFFSFCPRSSDESLCWPEDIQESGAQPQMRMVLSNTTGVIGSASLKTIK